VTRVAALMAVAVLAWCQEPAATVQGFVHDSHDKVVPGATVWLQLAGGKRLTTHTETDGSYRFTGLQEGPYTLHAETAGGEAGSVGPFRLGSQEAKKADLKLAKAEFFDEPNFVVAGVTTPSSGGVHGPDTAWRSTEALAKATASLTKPAAVTENPTNAALHHTLAGLAESGGDALEGAREYQRAAELEPSESYLFDWGSDLLTHRAGEPATEVFSKGHRLFPHSLRMLLGLAAAWYARADYHQAAQYFFEACDLDPADPRSYLLLGQAKNIEVTEGYLERMARFAKLQPDNAMANYYYAISLWKHRKGPEDSQTPTQVESLLKKAAKLDPKLGAAYVQLGILYSDRKDFPNAVVAFQKAISVSPELEEPHYRLAQVYRQTGDTTNAQRELALFNQLSKQSAAAAERERDAIPQLVISLRH